MKTLAAFCFSILLAIGVAANAQPTMFEDMANELLYDIFGHLNYPDWLALNDFKGNKRLQGIIQNTVVSEMVILPEHVGKPIPKFLSSVCAPEQQSEHNTELVSSRLRKVLEEATRIMSISLTNVPVDRALLDLMYIHKGSLQILSIKSGAHGGTSALQSGWLKEFTRLRTLEFSEDLQRSIVFPADFEPLTELVDLDFSAPGSSLPFDAFQHLKGLRNLKLQVYDFPTGILEPLVKLRVLDLENQTATHFSSRTFEGLVKLRRIVLPKDGIYTVEANAFSRLGELTSIKIKNSNLFSTAFVLVPALKRELGPKGFVLDADTYEFVRPKQVKTK